MAFTDLWDAAFEAAPADSENINLGANRIRGLKVAIRERMQVDHVWEDDQQDGMHNKLSLVPQTTAPTPSSPTAFLYTQIIGAYNELLYMDSAGNIIQLTERGFLFPFAVNDFSVGQDLAVTGNVAIGENLSINANHINDFALFGNIANGDTTVQFGLGTYLTFDRVLGKITLVVANVVQQVWPP